MNNSANTTCFSFISSGKAYREWWIYFILYVSIPFIGIALLLPSVFSNSLPYLLELLCAFLVSLLIKAIYDLEYIGNIELFKEKFEIQQVLGKKMRMFNYEDIYDIDFYDVKMKLWGLLLFKCQRMVVITMNNKRKFYFISDDIVALEKLQNAILEKYKPFLENFIRTEEFDITKFEFGQDLWLKNDELTMNPAKLPLKYAKAIKSPNGIINIVCDKGEGNSKVWLPLYPGKFKRIVLLKYLLDEIIPQHYDSKEFIKK